MDQSKLYKAFERNKTLRSSAGKNDQRAVKAESAVAVSEQKVIADLVPSESLLKRDASLKDMRNPNPMAIADMKKNKLVYSGMKNRAVLNAYRDLRIQLTDKQESENFTVMISSVDSSDNSVLTAMNLAISFSLDINSSALLVDCNPYGTDLQSLITSVFDIGITDYIQDQKTDLDKIIYPSGIERVSVIPAGNNSSSAVEQFSSNLMQELLYELRNRYSDRFIVLNAPPVLSSSEARVLARYCDHNVLTVPYGKADINMIEDAVEALGAANVSGIVYQQ
jgi:protein-tyrosine kinase